MSGLETAAYLAQTGNTLDIIEMADKIGPGIGFQLLTDAKSYLSDFPVNYYPGHRLIEVCSDAVIAVQEGNKVRLPADYVVLALGVRGDAALAEELKAEMSHVYVLGDAVKSGRISDAIHSAFDCEYYLR